MGITVYLLRDWAGLSRVLLPVGRVGLKGRVG